MIKTVDGIRTHKIHKACFFKRRFEFKNRQCEFCDAGLHKPGEECNGAAKLPKGGAGGSEAKKKILK